ncbi:hypothetical protein QTP88_022655 [Uroleucon formosanum]
MFMVHSTLYIIAFAVYKSHFTESGMLTAVVLYISLTIVWQLKNFLIMYLCNVSCFYLNLLFHVPFTYPKTMRSSFFQDNIQRLPIKLSSDDTKLAQFAIYVTKKKTYENMQEKLCKIYSDRLTQRTMDEYLTAIAYTIKLF